MKFFIDTAEIDIIKDLSTSGLIDGVTTNPSLIAKSGASFLSLIKEICNVVKGPVSAEVTATDYKQMLIEAYKLVKISEHVVIKLPLSQDGIKACSILSKEGISTNMTLCFSVGQAILAAKAGASYISPFVGRLDDISSNGMKLISDIVNVYKHYSYWNTKILVASVRSPQYVVDTAKLGVDVITIPPKILNQIFNHPLTEEGIAIFLKDWNKTGQSIIE